MEQHQHQTTSTPQIRSRITVVCAECKRLKLKCDRRSPCNSCLKRDTVARCIYSPAAAEKVDLHSLNNRLIHVEAMLAQVTAGTFQSTYPLAQPQNIPSGPSSSCVALTTPAPNPGTGRSMALPSGHHHHHPASVISHTHDAPHPLALTLEELRYAWVDSSESSRSSRSASGRPIPTIKHEMSPSELDQQKSIRLRYSSRYPHARHPNPQAYLPPLSIYYSSTSTYGSNTGYNFLQTSPSAIPTVSSAVLDLLPSTPVCSRILAQAQLILSQRPVPLPGGWRAFETRAIQLLNQRSNSAPSNPISERRPGGELDEDDRDTRPLQHLPFFAVLCSILALGAAVSPPEVVDPENINAGFLYALAQQALSVWETSSSGRRDEMENIWFLVACLSSVGYLLISTPEYEDEMDHPSGAELLDRKPRAIFPLVGKMVNVAREIGLGKERAGWQDEDNSLSGTEVKKQGQIMWEEVRRMIWWEIMFYDLFTSDALGHPSLISPLSYSVNMPEMLDSAVDAGAKYVLARFRLVQLAQRVKHRLSHPDCCCGYTFDQAILLEDEVRKWSREFVSLDEEDKGEEKRHGWELSLTAQLLVLRAYVPFLVTASSAASAKKQASGAPASGKGSTKTVEKPQINGNATAMATQSCLGAAQTILRLGNKLHVSLSKGSMIGPVLMDFYPLERLVLDAIVITQSSTAVSVVSEVDIRRGLEILLEREALLSKDRREIWELTKRRGPIAAKIQMPPLCGNKRKHDQVECSDISQSDTLRKDSVAPVKQMKLSGPPPPFGVRYREGKLPHNNGLREEEIDHRWAGDNHSLVMNLHTGEARNGGQDLGEVDNRQRQPQPQQTGPFVTSPTSFSPEQHQSVQQRSTLDRLMQPMPHRTSVDHMQSRAMYPYEDGPNSATTPALAESYPGINHSTASSNSSSPYQASTSPFSGNPFGSPSSLSGTAPGPSQYPHDTQTSDFAPSESHSMASYPNTRHNVSFDNSRSMFNAEQSQTQSFDKPHPHAYDHATMESNQATTPSVVGPPSLGSHSHGASPPTFGAGHPGINAPIAPQGYYHPAPDSLSNYDGNAMHSLGMRINGSVPGTPRYEKTQMVYDKPHQHQSIPGGQSTDAHAHNQHVMMSNGFEQQSSQGMTMGGGQQIQHHGSHQSWTSSQPPPPALVGVQAGQPYW